MTIDAATPLAAGRHRRTGRSRPGHRRLARRALRSPLAYLFVAPALLVFLVWVIGPGIFTVFISLFKWNSLNASKSRFIGLHNYASLMDTSRSPSFLSTMGISLYFVVAMVVLGTALALGLALLVQRGTRALITARTAFFTAHVTPLVATSLVWVWIFNSRYGLANAVLHLFGIPSIDWLGNSTWAMPAVILFTLWHEVGFTTLIFVGALANVSRDLHEAAELDGCNRWQEFWAVTLPQIRPYLALVIVIGSISSLQAFTQFFMLTGGGPGYSTATLGFQLYQEAFIVGDTGYAAALAVVLFLITLVLSLVQMKLTNSTDK